MVNLFKVTAFIAVLTTSFYLVSSIDPKILSERTLSVKLIVALMSGIFYTSFLTAPLSVVLFVILAATTNIYLLTIFGGMGAVLGDLLIIKFFRVIFKAFSFVTHTNSFKNLKKKLQQLHLDLLAHLLGMVIIISPFPDELGLVLLGASKLSYFKLAGLTFILNSVGILIILFTFRAVS